jgi:hypothetical protein
MITSCVLTELCIYYATETTVKQIEDAFKEFFILYAVLRSLPYVMKSADC